MNNVETTHISKARQQDSEQNFLHILSENYNRIKEFSKLFHVSCINILLISRFIHDYTSHAFNKNALIRP